MVVDAIEQARHRFEAAGIAAGGNPDAESAARKVLGAVYALAEYARLTGEGRDESVETVVTDLLTDLHHMCFALDLDFSLVLDQAERQYGKE